MLGPGTVWTWQSKHCPNFLTFSFLRSSEQLRGKAFLPCSQGGREAQEKVARTSASAGQWLREAGYLASYLSFRCHHQDISLLPIAFLWSELIWKLKWQHPHSTLRPVGNLEVPVVAICKQNRRMSFLYMTTLDIRKLVSVDWAPRQLGSWISGWRMNKDLSLCLRDAGEKVRTWVFQGWLHIL